MQLINDHLAVKARLLPPAGDGFLLLAGEVGALARPLSHCSRPAGRPAQGTGRGY
ncbi:hypothetical protein [Nonomuraea basaltis]|uniref:hypothetical protein n=1 Tax=Nonomuraea basaltis TaxID=2495887 RepID=UPI00197E06A2|nr:hypothetical protein [Nonomuraea basaltis]